MAFLNSASFVATIVILALVVVMTSSSPARRDDRGPEVNSQRAVECMHGNRTYSAGQRFKVDRCTTCRCSRHGRRPHCIIQDCATLANCRHVERTDDECCGRCVEFGCQHKGHVYAAGEMVSETACERCTCPVGGGAVVCSPLASCHDELSVNCVDYVIDPSTCCRRCPNGENCWLNDRVLSQGDVVDMGHCRKCRCPPTDHRTPFWSRSKGRQAVCDVDKNCQQ